jgi:hypothetical protein
MAASEFKADIMQKIFEGRVVPQAAMASGSQRDKIVTERRKENA